MSGLNTPRARIVLVLCSALALAGVLAAVVAAVDVPIATITVGRETNAIAVNPVSNTVYVTNMFSDSFNVIDGASDSIVATFGDSGGDLASPNCVLVNAVASPARAYVGNFWSGTLNVVDDASRAVVATVTSLGGTHGGGPRAFALEPSGDTKLYVAEYGTNSVAVLNGTTYELIKRIPVGSVPRALGIFSSVPRKRVYVANSGSGTVSVIDATAADAVVATVTVGGSPKAIAVDDVTGFAYVTNEASDTVSVIGDEDELVATVGVGDRPIGIAVDAAGGRVFVANNLSDNVSVIRTADHTVEATVAVQGRPWSVAVDATTRKGYVTNQASGTVTVIDSALSVTHVTAGVLPSAIAINTGVTPSKAYVANKGSVAATGSVTVIQDNGEAAVIAGSRARALVAGSIGVTVDPAPPGEALAAITGSASSTRPVYPSGIVAVWVRVDGEPEWQRAILSEGAGTPVARWRLDLAVPLGAGTHSVEVLAFDDTGAATATSDQGSAAQSPVAAGHAAGSVTVSVSQQTATTLQSVIPASGPVRDLAVSVRTADGAAVPGGFVEIQRWTIRGWRFLDDLSLSLEGAAQIRISTPGTYRARFLGYPGYERSDSAPLVVRQRTRYSLR